MAHWFDDVMLSIEVGGIIINLFIVFLYKDSYFLIPTFGFAIALSINIISRKMRDKK